MRGIRFNAADDVPALNVPVRMTVFAQRTATVGRGKRARTEVRGVAWQGWNADAAMEQRMARLRGAGSFYWPGALRALVAARAAMRADRSVAQIKLETIGGREIGRLYQAGGL